MMAKPQIAQGEGIGDVSEGVGGALVADIITEPLSMQREEFAKGKAPGAKKMANELLAQIPVEQEAKFLESAKDILLGPGEDMPKQRPVSVQTADGFDNEVAQEVFIATGNRNHAKRADEAVKLLGGDKELYQQVKHFARNAGQNNEIFWLKQHLGEMVAKEEHEAVTMEDIEAVGGPDERRKEDDNAASGPNVTISELLGKSTLSKIRSRAKEMGISNARFLKALVKVSLQGARRKGLAGHYEPAPKAEKAVTQGDLLATVFEALGKLGFKLTPPTQA